MQTHAFTSWPLALLLLAGTAGCGDAGSGNSDPSTTTDTTADSVAPTASEVTVSPTSTPTSTTNDPTTQDTSEPSTTSTTSTPTTGDPNDTTSTTDASSTGDLSSTTDPVDPGPCVPTSCQGKTYECGDCIDNDEDGLIDANDPDCWGPCDNNESGFKGNIAGQQNQSTCTVMDCYFDADSGAGNDKCYWSHACDPLEPGGCTYNPNAPIPGAGMSCAEAQVMQSQQCEDVCGPLVPNGCDCFGCCEITVGDTTHTVFLGSGEDDAGTCTLADVADPTKCNPCTQVAGCLNPCEPDNCEICIGQTKLPKDCEEAGCEAGVESCKPENNNADCPEGHSCVTGCCVIVPG